MPFAFTCGHCGAEFVRKNSRPARFCSHRCSAVAHGGWPAQPEEVRNRVADLRRGTGKGGGYVKRGGRHEHRVVAEKTLGRPLQPGEIVAHRDRAKTNNASENLTVFSSRAEFSRALSTGLKRAPKVACKEGHPFTEANTRLGSKGERRCVICQRKYDREWKQAQRRQRSTSDANPQS